MQSSLSSSLQLLHKMGCKPDPTTPSSTSALHYAASSCSLPVIKWYLSLPDAEAYLKMKVRVFCVRSGVECACGVKDGEGGARGANGVRSEWH